MQIRIRSSCVASIQRFWGVKNPRCVGGFPKESKPNQSAPAPHNGLSRIQVAKEKVEQAGSYLELGDAQLAAQLLQEAERIVSEPAKEQELTLGTKRATAG